jgi:hypothetical protein
VWVIFLLFVYIVSSQIPYLFISKSTLPNVMSHFLLGGLIFYYSLFVETVVLWDIKMLSLQLCDTVVSLLSGVGLIATQHNFFQKNVSSNEWSDKDIQHTALGAVLILVGICNVFGILFEWLYKNNCAIRYLNDDNVNHNLNNKKKYEYNNHRMKYYVQMFISFAQGSLGLGLVSIGIVIFFHKQANTYAVWLHLCFCVLISLTGILRFIMNQLSVETKILACTVGMSSGTLLLLSAKPIVQHLLQIGIHPILIIIYCVLFASFISFLNVYTFYQKKKVEETYINKYRHVVNERGSDDTRITSDYSSDSDSRECEM